MLLFTHLDKPLQILFTKVCFINLEKLSRLAGIFLKYVKLLDQIYVDKMMICGFNRSRRCKTIHHPYFLVFAPSPTYLSSNLDHHSRHENDTLCKVGWWIYCSTAHNLKKKDKSKCQEPKITLCNNLENKIHSNT